MNSIKSQLKEGLLAGIRKGWNGFVWMVKILLPISLLTALLAWSGWLEKGQVIIQPVMDWLSLPAVAALPLMIGMLTGIYGGIAAMVVLPLTTKQMTLIAIFLLMAHNLIQEGVIQGKSGINPAKATVFRLICATLTVMVVASFLEVNTNGPAAPVASHVMRQPFLLMLWEWAVTSSKLCLKIFLIIMTILTTLEVFKKVGWIEHIVRLCRPFLKALGLSEKAGILWMTAAIFGLAYGAAVIVEEANEGHLAKEELEALHLSIGINHSLIEDPALFLALGLSAFWLWIPRLIAAVIAVRLFSLYHLLFTKGQSAEL
ncbi:MAG: iron transporter [Deltaproteobacteria bacterium]|nr:iron transporter [Deltaproteobacteria bacterium]